MSMVVVMEGPSGEAVALGHGGLIGRLWSADLHVNDPRVSEAHAMVSQRGGDVRLLALRGRLGVDGRWLTEVVLRAGLVVGLAPGVEVRVLDLRVPDRVLAVEADGLARQVLTGVTSLFGRPQPRLHAGWIPDADHHVWHDGDAWMRDTSSPRPLAAGDAWEVAGVTFRAVEHRTQGVPPTVGDAAGTAPITLVARWDTVHLQREGEPTVVLTGHMARVISQLATVGAALPWEELARLRWTEGDRDLLRHRWDMQVRRLRLRLAAHRVRTDFVRADGSGLIELVLGQGDVVVDET